MDEKQDRKDRFKKRVRRRNKIERELIAQLKDEKNSSRYQELIKDYLFMWDTIQELKYDIKEKGVSVYWQNSATQFGYKENESIRAMTTVNQQMLKILGSLNIGMKKSEEVDADEKIRL